MVRNPLIYNQYSKYLLSAYNVHPACYLHFYADKFLHHSIPQTQLFNKI